MIESKYTCDGCGDSIKRGGKNPGYSHFELNPITNVPDSGWVYAIGWIHEDTRQFCFECKHKMMAALPIKYYCCGLCSRYIKGEKGQTLECLEKEHDKEFHPNYTKVTFGEPLKAERAFTEPGVFTEDQSIKLDNCCVDSSLFRENRIVKSQDDVIDEMLKGDPDATI